MSSPPNNVAVIGAGPAGLMAAEVLAQGGADVTVYDAMPSAGRKFLMAGRGGLNLTHSEPLPAFLARYREAMPHLAAGHRSVFADRLCATGATRWGRKRSSAPAAGYFQRPSRHRPCCARGCGGWTRWASDWRCVTAGPAGTSRAVCFSNAGRTARHQDARDRAGARRRKLAAAGLRRRMGGNARGQGRADIAAAAGELRLHRRVVGYFSRPLRGPAAQGCGVDIRCAQRARRSDHHPQRHRRRRGLRAVGRVARGHPARWTGDAATLPCVPISSSAN